MVLALVATGCGEAPKPAAAAGRGVAELTILTPHNRNIRSAFELGFADWHRRTHRTDVRIKWIERGTPQCVQYVADVHTAPREVAPRGAAPDVFFGGGPVDHALLAERGWTVPLPQDLQPGAIPAEVNGVPTRDAERRWVATGLTTFGLLVNQAVCEARGIAAPNSFSDLADPRFAGWVALAEPAASGSNRESLTLVLQKYGWDEGWPLVLRVLANARALNERSTAALDQVRSGVSLAAFAVNFDGQALAEQSGGRLRFLEPAQETAVSPDMISVLGCGTQQELARRFVQYVLSEEGQAMWSVREDARRLYAPTLYHYPILPAVYETYAADLSISGNPLTTPLGQRVNADEARQQSRALLPLVAAACGDNHVKLQLAWERIVRAGMPESAVRELTAAPCSKEEAYALGERYANASEAEAAQIIQEWSAKFAARYERAMSMTSN